MVIMKNLLQNTRRTLRPSQLQVEFGKVKGERNSFACLGSCSTCLVGFALTSRACRRTLGNLSYSSLVEINSTGGVGGREREGWVGGWREVWEWEKDEDRVREKKEGD